MKKKNLLTRAAILMLAALILMPANLAGASVTGSTGDGWIIHQTDGTIDNCYRYGPSIILNEDNSADAWFASPGREAWYNNFTAAGTHTPVQLAGTATAGQKFYSNKYFSQIAVCCPSWSNNIGNLTLTLYRWNTDYATSIQGASLASQTFANFIDNQYLTLVFSKELEPGYYLWVLSNPTETVGVWKYTGSSLADTQNFYNGQPSTGDYDMKIRYWFWDIIRYKHSSDGGRTWGSESVVLEPDLRKRDHYSVCDPGVIKFGGYYYLGYTSTEDIRGTDNDVYIARSASPTGPWQKWNGSGWGGDPAPFIVHTGPTYCFGTGEPSFVLKDGTVYIYYTWSSEAADGTPINETRVAMAPASDANWPGSLTYRGVAVSKRPDQGMDSLDVKYVDSFGKFIGINTARRMGPRAYIQMWESTDGLSFYPSNISQDYVQPFCHNNGISGTPDGHLDLSDSNFVAYAYGSQWANWCTYLNPVSISSSNQLPPPRIYTAVPGNGQVRLEFMTNSQAMSYKVKYGTVSGGYTNTVTGITTGSCTITGLTNGTRYFFTVVAINANGDSMDSEQASALPQPFAVSPRTAVAASSQLAGWEASKAIDSDLLSNYSTVGHTSEEGPEWIYVDTGANRAIARITLTPRQRSLVAAPRLGSAVKIQVGYDTGSWSDAEYEATSIVDTDGYTKQVVTLKQPTYGRYVRIYCSKLGNDGNSIYYLQLGDIKIEDLPVTAAASSVNGDWAPTRVIDGDLDNGCYSSALSSQSSTTQWVSVDLGSSQKVTGIMLKPRASGLCFPVDFKLQSSSDGSTWTDIPGQSYTNYPNPGSSLQSFRFASPVSARYLKLYATKLGSDGTNYALQLIQFYVSYDLPYTATASSALSGWEASRAADCNPATAWSSNYHSTANSTEWIKLDMGSVQKVSGLRLTPREDFCFPADFKIEYSSDNTTWYEVNSQNYTGYVNPADNGSSPDPVQLFSFNRLVEARYIRITATKLRADNFGGYYFQLSDIYIDP